MDKAIPSLKIGEVEVFWLDGGQIRLDGGPMFGPVPKVLWSEKVEVGEDNCIAIENAPLLLLTPSAPPMDHRLRRLSHGDHHLERTPPA